MYRVDGSKERLGSKIRVSKSWVGGRMGEIVK